MDLLTLVELSLGSQAHSGIVNFNYLHELLVQIVLRLNNEQLVAAAGGSRSRSIQQLLPAASSHPDAIVTSAVQAGLPVSSSHHVAQGPATSQQPSTSSSLQQQPSASILCLPSSTTISSHNRLLWFNVYPMVNIDLEMLL